MATATYKNSWFIYWPMKKPGTRKFLVTCMVLTFLITIFYYTQSTLKNTSSNEIILDDTYTKLQTAADKYLINTSKCKIRNGNPFNEDVIKFVHKEAYVGCSNKPLLTYLEYNNSVVTLNINRSLLNDYSILRVYCCYSAVTRIVEPKKSDDNVRFSECRPFEEKVVIDDFVVRVKCSNSMGSVLYENVHSIVSPRQVTKEKLKHEWPENSTPFSVLLVGIDSISKLHLVRTMPKVHEFLETNNFVNLRGYMKIGDNTFPNLMAILTGRTWQQVYDYCSLKDNKLNGCDIIWDRFNKLGYITAYAEDESSISTFNYLRLGFEEAPTDFYFRPYFIASEMLPSKRRYSLSICSGPETSGERILNSAKDFIINLNKSPKFGLFWMNSFSHDNFNLPSSMDDKIQQFLIDTYPHLNNTILIFFSDHGFRFGDIRHTHTGWLEERLPFIYIYFPHSFKMKHPRKYNNFLTNSKRVTNPFDVYMTLQDVLHMTDSNYKVQPSQACPKCHSLFEEVDEKRTCQDAAIDQHWCLCTGYAYISTKEEVVSEAAEFIVSELNKFIRQSKEGSKCARYYLKQVIFSGITDAFLNERNQTVEYLLVHLETRPAAKFEATVAVASQSSSRFTLVGEFSRTDRYADNSKCIDGSLKKYCYCDGVFTIIKSAICNFLNCF